jgi:hypothetical protein
MRYTGFLPSLGKATPLRLSIAAKLAFPDGSMKASGLRKEAKRGRLDIERIAGRDYVTLESIERMREKCRVEPKPSASISASESVRQERESGSSSTAMFKSARASAMMTAHKLKKRSPTT